MNKNHSTITFADIAHQMLSFDLDDDATRLIVSLIDNRWLQRLRRISQTGNTKLVYMYAEHSRFGHSLGVCYLALTLMNNLKRYHGDAIAEYYTAVAVAALLHDLGHVAPGSHLGEKVWSSSTRLNHESITARIIKEDAGIQNILKSHSPELPEQVIGILQHHGDVPPWAYDIISGDGWNADRGNWSLVDSALCAVSYGRYNVPALIDAFRISPTKQLVLGENRLDALVHFYVARDSMYRQVYQHRVLQAADALTISLIKRVRHLLAELSGNSDSTKLMDAQDVVSLFATRDIFIDTTMALAISCKDISSDLPLNHLYYMTEHWWSYHLSCWEDCRDSILSDLSRRLNDRDLLKTIRIDSHNDALIAEVEALASKFGYDPNYYVTVIDSSDRHRSKNETAPLVILDSGRIVPITEVEPLLTQLGEKSNRSRLWVTAPKEVKEALGIRR